MPLAFDPSRQSVSDGIRILVRPHGERADFLQPAEPGRLALGELSGACLDAVDRLVEGRLAGEHRDDLAVADPLRGDRAQGSRAGLERAHLFDQAGVEEATHATVDPVIKVGRGSSIA